MTSSFGDGSESSLPTRAAHTIRSSPPIFAESLTWNSMDNDIRQKSEPPLTQGAAENTQVPLRRGSSANTERPPSAQQQRDDANKEVETKSEGDSDDEQSGPAERIANFDWDSLHEQYHEAINKCHDQETELMQEWENLMKYFRIWAQSGHAHETDRSFSRLRTRMTHVQHSEETLEKTRKHYIEVVAAFESALNLLKASSFGRA